jgi:hypothetical protein
MYIDPDKPHHETRFVPSQLLLDGYQWFQRATFYDPETLIHYPFPVVVVEGTMTCLCRDCSPAEDVGQEETLQTAYLKAMESNLGHMNDAVLSRGGRTFDDESSV